MRVALGLKAHSGWAALVALAWNGRDLHVIDRRRVELVDPGASWAKAPYHAAEDEPPAVAQDIVARGVAGAREIARREIRAAVERTQAAQHEVAACAVLVGQPMPGWSVEEILAVHFRMHRAEGVLFQDALVRAAEACRLELVRVPVKQLTEHARAALGTRAPVVVEQIAALGKAVGPPWGKDQKEAALAAAIALSS